MLVANGLKLPSLCRVIPPPIWNGSFGKKFKESAGGAAPDTIAGPKPKTIPPAPFEVMVTADWNPLEKLIESANASDDIRPIANPKIVILLSIFIPVLALNPRMLRYSRCLSAQLPANGSRQTQKTAAQQCQRC